MKVLRGIAIAAGVLIAGAGALYLSGVLRIEVTNQDPRPVGTIDQIDALRERKDLNVLFILTDTLRAGRLHAYGYSRETSPTFDYMAETGVRFARHLAQSSWTKCSMASLWTGMYPQRTGVLRTPHAAPEGAKMPAEILREAGFRTAGLWRNGWVAPTFGFSQGFEVYERPTPKAMSRNMRVENPNITLEGTDNDVIDAAEEFLRIHGRERFFLYVHLMDVHQYLYDTNSAVFGATYSDIYDNSVLHTDGVIGRLLTLFVDQGLLQKTLVVMAADHGEAFGERGIEGHAREVDLEETDIPLILGFPFRLDPGVVVSTRTRNVDIWPTVLDLLGLPRLMDPDGRSLVATIKASARNKPIPDDVPGIAHLERGWGRPELPSRPTVAVTKGPYRFILQLAPDASRDQRVETLYDASNDPQERKNVIEQNPEIAAELRALADAYLLQTPPPWVGTPTNVDLDEKEADELRALGYAVP
ncbi:MAG: sulfatase [Deltaproteobacteria bacterium]|nr:sulfatase [Deltaproteobacteria bacterium]